jgi:hypothetical protein
MPRKKKSSAQSEGAPSTEPKIPKELLDQLIAEFPRLRTTRSPGLGTT